MHKYELSVHVCKSSSELQYIELKEKFNALGIKVKGRTKHCNKSQVMPCVHT